MHTHAAGEHTLRAMASCVQLAHIVGQPNGKSITSDWNLIALRGRFHMTVGCSRPHRVVQWWSIAVRLAVSDVKLEVEYVLRLI